MADGSDVSSEPELAARHGRSRGKALRDELDGLGEESQESGEE